MLDPNFELSNDTLLANVQMPTILRNALHRAGLKSVGEVRSTTATVLSRIRYVGPVSLAFLRRTLGVDDH